MVRAFFDPKRALFIIGLCGAAILAVMVLWNSKPVPDASVAIILSPHYDDAVLSLGGFMSASKHEVVVVNFFTAAGDVATSTSWDSRSGFASNNEAVAARAEENRQALKILTAKTIDLGYVDSQYRAAADTDYLEFELTKDIQSLLAGYSGREVAIYAPALFSASVTHPDHALVHKALLAVADEYPSDNVTFYIYEDYPYVEEYNKTAIVSLKKNIEVESDRLFESVEIALTDSALGAKEAALKRYESQILAFQALGKDIVKESRVYTAGRCMRACEVVYKLFKVAR